MQNQDEEHLKILMICHYVYGGLSMFFGLFPLLYVAFGVMMLTMPPGRGGPPQEFGYFLIVLGLGATAFVWALAGCILAAGRFLGARRNRIFCIVIAAISCINMPLGTILGVFTLIVLMRPSVVELFDGKRLDHYERAAPESYDYYPRDER